jgi:exopolysaccharide biosynthesis protein
VRRQPRPLVIHIVTIDLQAPGLGFLVTPGDAKAKRPLKAQTVRQFLQANRAQLAINGDYFWPWYSYSILNYYPHSGDPVSVRGIAASRGVVYSRGSKRYPHPTLHLSQTNRAQICQPREVPAQPIYNAVSGNFLLLHDGKINVPEQGSEEWTAFQPRNSVGLDKARRHLILLEVDGRQTGYSEGTTLAETAQLLRENGAWEAINLDGGGSETLIIEGPKGPETLNSPIDCNIPGRERAVANHLGVFAQRQ